MVAIGVVLMSAACNAILGITDLSAPDLPDAGNDASGDAVVPPTDGAQPDAADGGCVTCAVTESQDAAIYPTWLVTSDLTIRNVNLSVVPPLKPVYTAAGAGAVRESTSGLTWRTAYASTATTYAGAIAACTAIGTDWRVPTRIEIATTQYRAEELNADSGARTTCVPPPFDAPTASNTWTATAVPAAGDAGLELFVADESHCAFLASTPDLTNAVRCVKGVTKDARFEVTASTNIVHAIDTNLDWERTGTVIQTFAQAKSHCDSIGFRLPVIQELYGIVDTRVLSLTDTCLFVAPPAVARAMLSQTLLSVDSTGGPSYAAVALVEGARGQEDAMQLDDGSPDIFLRCVRQHVP